MKAKNLVIVESPAKARTVGRYLGAKYDVRASVGHIRDLPLTRLGVDVENDFEPRYVIPVRKKEVVKQLKDVAKDASTVYLATDPDREGEAISWHLVHALGLQGKQVKRVVFHEITKEAIKSAFAEPREIDTDLVDAQQARRVLDRLVGYKLSPLLRSKMGKKGLSAGRVQSVAVRLIVDREREIEAFTPEEYWTLEAELQRVGERALKRNQFKAQLRQVDGKKADLKKRNEVEAVLAALQGAAYRVTKTSVKDTARHASAPFTTSTLQQEASRKLGFTARRTMAVAQQLYEGLSAGRAGTVGLITYMRTDSTNLAASAVEETRAWIRERFGAEYLPPTANVYATRNRRAQEAHEAIRPTDITREPESIKQHLTGEQFRLYNLIWKRTVASQMAPARVEVTTVDIEATTEQSERRFDFRATGHVTRFAGFMQVYVEDDDQKGEKSAKATVLPPLAEGDAMQLIQLLPEQHFTEPPARYTEASLVKALEEYGIGRPSTYAPTISTIQDRGYVDRRGKQLQPTELGVIVSDLLVKHFPKIVNVQFTAGMEDELDEVARGDRAWRQLLGEFYQPFAQDIAKAEENMETVVITPEPAGIDCDLCGRPMLIKRGRFGKFIACSGFPECRNTKQIVQSIGVDCPQCGGDLVEKRTKKRRTFYGCVNYPTCNFAVWQKPLSQPCEECGGLVVVDAKKGAVCSACGAPARQLLESERTVS